MRVGRALGALVASGLLAGGLALTVAAPPAGAAYASNGEPVWIPRNAANAADQLRADNRALARVGNAVYLGGDFTELAPELGAPGVAVARLAAFDATTGVPVASFRPQLDGKVYALVSDSSTNTLYVGGSFTGGFAILDATTGAPKGTQLTTDGEVRALYRDGNDMYVGGQFQRFGGSGNRKMMARFDVGTLAVDQLRAAVHRRHGRCHRHVAEPEPCLRRWPVLGAERGDGGQGRGAEPDDRRARYRPSLRPSTRRSSPSRTSRR